LLENRQLELLPRRQAVPARTSTCTFTDYSTHSTVHESHVSRVATGQEKRGLSNYQLGYSGIPIY
jgi:hypothetical protein